jgi:nanoRNase/pAp phosphatase (c-di-AMP/oligoRNAs hydrolase)
MSYFGKGWYISVSQNPWNQEKRKHNIKEICEIYGGGGHPGVGGIPVTTSLEKARQVLSEVKDLLRS